MGVATLSAKSDFSRMRPTPSGFDYERNRQNQGLGQSLVARAMIKKQKKNNAYLNYV